MEHNCRYTYYLLYFHLNYYVKENLLNDKVKQDNT